MTLQVQKGEVLGNCQVLHTGPQPAAGAQVLVTNKAGNAIAEGTDIALVDPPVLPACGRNVSLTYTDAAGGDAVASFEVVGYDQFGAPQREELAHAAGGAALTTGVKIFSKITRITPLDLQNNVVGDSISFGIGDRVGLPVQWNPSSLEEIVSIRKIDADQTTVAGVAVNSDNLDSTYFAITQNGAAITAGQNFEVQVQRNPDTPNRRYDPARRA